jgi:hypothetical protein
MIMSGIIIIRTEELERLKNESFDRGEKFGKDLAIEELRNAQKHDCVNLSDYEKDLVMNFLETHNLEFGYNLFNKGFYIMKRKP